MLTTNQIKLFASLKQKKFRLEHGKYLIEGFHLIEECLSSPHELEYIILRNEVDLQGHTAILEKIAQNKTIVEPLPEKLFNKLTDTESSQGIVGVVSRPEYNKTKSSGDLIIALDKVSDPGNLGTIIRTAYWFGVDWILLSDGSADPYNPKVVRSTQGGIFHTNITEDAELAAELKKLESKGYSVYLFTLDTERSLSQISESGKSGKSVLVFGSEAHGISKEILDMGFEKVKIEGYSASESLNVAISTGIALYEFKQHAKEK
ncbi:MAG TPA: RNA methyltransferase [Ignavibacteria bacterium]|nr:RNA methyltransferase [Ignavibacteria bacterium]